MCTDGPHGHNWNPRPGLPLACGDCGELWPGEPDWPPEYIPRVEGNHHEEIVASGMWSVRDMINALHTMEV